MRKTVWIVTLFLSLVVAGRAQQDRNNRGTTAPGAPAATLRFLPPGGPDAVEPPACPAKFDDSLETNGIASDFLHGIKAPKATRQGEPEFSDAARKALKKQHVKHFEGVSIVSMIVGVDGVPRDLCLKKSAGYGLDVQAAKAALQYRFEPATKDGDPVPARISVEMNFRLY